ncbi:MAG: transcriptional regulator, partial [Thermoguttaceae bacterium]
MNEPVRVENPSINDISQEMVDLSEAIKLLPEDFRQKVEPALLRVVESTRRRRRILALVQDALSQLRLDMKY